MATGVCRKNYIAAFLPACMLFASVMQAMPKKQKIFYRKDLSRSLKNLDSFRSEGSFEGWMRRIFVNTAIEHFRRKRYLQPVTEKEENTLEGKYTSVLDDLAERDILELVQELSPGYRTVFNMYVVEGYTHKEIGDMLGISEGTSKSQLSRAKVILQEMVRTFIDKQRGVRSK